MKKMILLFSLLICLTASAQKDIPGKLVVKVVDTAGKIMANQKVMLSVEYEPTNNNKVVHTEKFNVTTNAKGMATLVRGKGIERTGSYAKIARCIKLKDDVWIYVFRNTGDMTDDYLLKTMLYSSKSNLLFEPPRIVRDTEVNQ